MLVSGTFWSGDSFRIMDLIDRKELICVLSDPIIEEYNKVLQSDRIIEKIVDNGLILPRVVQKIIENSAIVKPEKRFKIIKADPDDDKFIEAAVEGRSDYIISQDRHLLRIKEFRSIGILSPKDFLRLYYDRTRSRK